MAPKEKAEEIVQKITFEICYLENNKDIAKRVAIECAKIAVTEIIESASENFIIFWCAVRFELDKLT